MTPEVQVLELLVEVHRQLFNDSLLHDVPKSFLMKRKEDLKVIARHLMVSIRVLNKIIEEEKEVDEDIELMKKECHKFFSHIHKGKTLDKEIQQLYKKAEDTYKLIESEENASQYIIEGIEKVLRNLDKLLEDMHRQYLNSHFIYLLNLNAPIKELKEAFKIMKKVWHIEKQLEEEDEELEELLMKLKEPGLKSAHSDLEKKEPRQIIEDIARVLHKMELS